MDFSSDNTAGASQAILAAILDANEGTVPAYGADPLTVTAAGRLCEVFERDLACFLVSTGTAANALALGAICPPFGAIFCHSGAHIMEDECGAPEMFTGGAKLVGIPGRAGKIAPEDFKAALVSFPRGFVHQVQPAALSLSQLTESGTVYTCQEIAALSALAHDAGLMVHIDGARFANAIVSLQCSPAEMSWKAGIDVLSFGATKNGSLACEAVIFFDAGKAASLPYLRKRAGHTQSKGRFLGAQMMAYLENGHWLDLAAAANVQAKRLAQGLAQIPGVRLPWPCAANEVFAILPQQVDAALKAGGAAYYPWNFRGSGLDCAPPGNDEIFVRLVTSFATSPSSVDQLLALAGREHISANR
ncbi:MAG: low specificity L-threonine aldolase [Beijerinckiaceae bacterium]|nr:low specificity L-threonine aldolase [Beijerinckiaceae bacterium]MCI0736505.1 low specificity L-threonine aldolase [Beijerinckiaceae bacterium]